MIFIFNKWNSLMAEEKVAFTPTVHHFCLPFLAVKSNNKYAFKTWLQHSKASQRAQANQSLQLIYKEKDNKTKPGDQCTSTEKISFQKQHWGHRLQQIWHYQLVNLSGKRYRAGVGKLFCITGHNAHWPSPCGTIFVERGWGASGKFLPSAQQALSRPD